MNIKPEYSVLTDDVMFQLSGLQEGIYLMTSSFNCAFAGTYIIRSGFHCALVGKLWVTLSFHCVLAGRYLITTGYSAGTAEVNLQELPANLNGKGQFRLKPVMIVLL